MQANRSGCDLLGRALEVVKERIDPNSYQQYLPSDPNLLRYEEVWSKVIKGGVFPASVTFEVTEVIGHVKVVNSPGKCLQDENPSKGGSWFRLLCLLSELNFWEEGLLYIDNTSIFFLVEDCIKLDFGCLTQLVREWMSHARRLPKVIEDVDEEGLLAYLLLAEIVFEAVWGGGGAKSIAKIDRIAQELLDAGEDRSSAQWGCCRRFVFGNSNTPQTESCWIALLRRDEVKAAAAQSEAVSLIVELLGQ